jgi:hypothetical protein
MNEIDAIELTYLKELIPNILYNKLIELKLTTIGQIRSISIEDFQKHRSVGKATINNLLEFKDLIENNNELLLQTYNHNCLKLLPINYQEDTNLLILIQSLLEDFLATIAETNFKTSNAKVRYLRNIDVIRKHYGLRSKKYENDKIAIRHRINRERVRQIIQVDFIPDLQKLLNGVLLEDWNCTCRPEVVNLIQSFKKDIAGFSILSEFNIGSWLKEYGLELNDNDFKSYLLVILNAWGFEKIPLSRHYLLQGNEFYADERLDKNTFLNVSTKVFLFLRRKVIPVPFDDIVIEVLEEHNVEDDFIKLICDINYDIEQLENGYYQIRFEKLSSINDYAYRILYERQKELTYNELLHLINKKLINYNKDISLESLKHTLKKDDFIVPISKTGIWTLKEFNSNIDSQVNLIIKTLRSVDIPLNVNEITQYINETFKRPDVTSRSVGSNLLNYKKHFIKLKGVRFSLIERSDLYQNEIVKILGQGKRKVTTKSEEIAMKAIEILKKTPQNKMSLKDLIKIIIQGNSHFGKMAIYKAINENPLLFRKENKSVIEKDITLFSRNESPESEYFAKYKWNDLKKILGRELTPIFISSIQPSYTINLDKALDLFFKVLIVDISTQCPELSDLADRILPTLNKFYIGASDRNDKLNFLKQIVTSQESFFKKLLFLVNSPDYLLIRSNKKGFGTVIEKLSKIDPRANRFKEIHLATNFEFGKHCSRAYNNRNLDTHSAKNWTETEIIETKTSCLVFMIYGVFEYQIVINR